MNKLTEEKRQELELRVKKTRNLDEYKRISVLLGHDKGYSIERIEELLSLSRSTIYAYLKEYEDDEKTNNDSKPTFRTTRSQGIMG